MAGCDGLNLKVSRADILKLRTAILQNRPALERWGSLKDFFVNEPDICLKIDSCLKTLNYSEAVIITLEHWRETAAGSATVSNLVGHLRDHQLNGLAGELEHEFINYAQGTGSGKGEKIPSYPDVGFWFRVSDLVHNFVGREDELQLLHSYVTEDHSFESAQPSSYAVLTSVNGLGGIGKTTLARKYAWSYRQEFDGNVIWIDAESRKSMEYAFICCAQELGRKFDLCLDAEAVVKMVYRSFTGKRCLFIFDNVEEFEGPNGVKPFLPDGLLYKPCLLMTSRRTDIGRKEKTLNLNVLSLEDSIQLLQSIPSATRDACIQLAEKLGRLPLALQQAHSYIINTIEEHEHGSAAIASYLIEFEENTKKILASGDLAPTGYTKTIAVTWNITMAQIRNVMGGRLAEIILRYIAYLYPDNIQLAFLLSFAFKPHEYAKEFWRHVFPLMVGRAGSTSGKRNEGVRRIKTAVLTLKMYSMVSYSEGVIKVHRLVQEVVKPSARKERRIVTSISNVLEKLYNEETELDQCVLHAQFLLPKAEKYLQISDYTVYTRLGHEFSQSLYRLPRATPSLVSKLLQYCAVDSENLTYKILQRMTDADTGVVAQYVSVCENLWHRFITLKLKIHITSVSILTNLTLSFHLGLPTQLLLLVFEYILHACDYHGGVDLTGLQAMIPQEFQPSILALVNNRIVKAIKPEGDLKFVFTFSHLRSREKKVKFFESILVIARRMAGQSAELSHRYQNVIDAITRLKREPPPSNSGISAAMLTWISGFADSRRELRQHEPSRAYSQRARPKLNVAIRR